MGGQEIRTATVTFPEPIEDVGTELYFASLDGEHFIGVSRPARAGDVERIAAMLEGDGNFKPMTIAPRGIKHIAMQDSGSVEFGVAV